MKIKDWIHAIDLTIKKHQTVLGGKYDDYSGAKIEMNEQTWKYICPLCEYAGFDCNNCIWVRFTGFTCSQIDKHGYDYMDDKQSIQRLNEWRERLLKEGESYEREVL